MYFVKTVDILYFNIYIYIYGYVKGHTCTCTQTDRNRASLACMTAMLLTTNGDSIWLRSAWSALSSSSPLSLSISTYTYRIRRKTIDETKSSNQRDSWKNVLERAFNIINKRWYHWLQTIGYRSTATLHNMATFYSSVQITLLVWILCWNALRSCETQGFVLYLICMYVYPVYTPKLVSRK